MSLIPFLLRRSGQWGAPGAAAVLLLAASVPGPAVVATDYHLVPPGPGSSPDYYCTWGNQGRAMKADSTANAYGVSGHSSLALAVNEKNILGQAGWINAYAPIRGDLIFLLDLGWDIPAGIDLDQQPWQKGSFELPASKFPSLKGEPWQRLRQLSDQVKAAGWKGVGLWVAAEPLGYGQDGRKMSLPEIEAFYRERARWCHQAGIAYWKVDYGDLANDVAFRQAVSRAVRAEAPELLVEHCISQGPLNDIECPYLPQLQVAGTGTYRAWDRGKLLTGAVAIVQFADVFRTYDVLNQLAGPTTLDRLAQIATGPSTGTARAVINCEDEPIMGAALGCSLGIMQHPAFAYADKSPDDVLRAVAWHRLAPAFGLDKQPTAVDKTLLRDTWLFRTGETWATWLNGKETFQLAPARLSRGLPLPGVRAAGPPPYVVAAKNPNGAISVATLPRSSSQQRTFLPLATVTVAIGAGTAPVGVFGRYEKLVLTYTRPRPPVQVLAQDLKAQTAVDITKAVQLTGTSLTISGRLIEQIGLSASSPDRQQPSPGLVLSLR